MSKVITVDHTNRAYEIIRRKIFLKELVPSQKLNHRELANSMNMSPTPVIQALKWLEFQGLIRHERNRGYFIESLDIEEVQEIYDLRIALESSNLAEVIKRVDRDGIRRLEEAREAHFKAFKQSFVRQAIQMDMEFHITLAKLSGSRICPRLLHHLFELLYLRYEIVIFFTRDMEDVGVEHQRIIDGVEARDLPASRQALTNHILHVRDLVLKGMHQDLKEEEQLGF